MLRFVQAELFESRADVILVSANAFVTRKHRLVMGRGAAMELRDRFTVDMEHGEHGIDWDFGQLLRNRALKHVTSAYDRRRLLAGGCVHPNYGVITISRYRGAHQGFGLFQVKHHWQEAASLALIRASARHLQLFVATHPGMTVAMNFPGIGNGRLYGERQAIVDALAQFLADENVTVHYR